MACIKAPTLRQSIGAAERFFFDRNARLRFTDLAGGTSLGGRLGELAGMSVLVATGSQLTTALALIELDGLARRLTILPPDADLDHLGAIIAGAEIDAVVLDRQSADSAAFDCCLRVVATAQIAPAPPLAAPMRETEWIMLTSGTTGVPKMVVHTLAGLTAAFRDRKLDDTVVWGTFYDIRRYGGLQIYLRAVLSGSPLVLSSAGESPVAFMERAAAAGVTHISGTPSHWRRALMSGEAGVLTPQYVRLSGEVADQAVLDSLRAAYPGARIGHAFASTEAGVAFDVNDGLAGFPAEFVEHSPGGIEMKVVDHTLRIRSGRTAARYLGAAPGLLVSDDGYVDTGDMVELKDGRYHFMGRIGGVINVGGLKVYPEEVESVLNADPRVRMSLVRARRNPITGAVVVADVVLAEPAGAGPADAPDLVKSELLNACRRTLAAHKVPAMLRFVESLEFNAAGKLVRPGA
jgi:acyl-coenzyme A synthetase/AMP-(fatty) acid ligase